MPHGPVDATPITGWRSPRLAAAAPIVGDRPAPLARLVLDLTRRRQRGRWAMQLDRAVATAPGRLVVVAHGVACAAFAFWAQLTPLRYRRPIIGAVLVEPARSPDRHATFSALPEVRLPFPSLLLSARPDGPDPTQRALATLWGSEATTTAALAERTWPWLVDATQLPIVAMDETAD